MDELDEPVQVLCCYLCNISVSFLQSLDRAAYCLILLIKVVYISIQNFHKQFNRHCSIHTRICHAKSTLQTFKHTLSVAVKLDRCKLEYLMS